MTRRSLGIGLLLSISALGLHGPDAAAQALPPKMSAKLLSQVAAPSTSQAGATNRPFRLDPDNEVPGLTFNPALERAAIAGSCSASDRSLCYDYRTGRAVYRPARKLMPEIAGMTRESLTLKRDKVTFHYSF